MARTRQTARRSRADIEDEDIPLSEDHGKICDTKSLYRTKKDENGQTSWTTDLPADITDTAENSETAKYALLIRNEKCYDGRRKFTIHSIVVQSPVLKTILGDIFKDYTGITVNVRRLEFHPPWHCFVHRWTKLVDTMDELCALAEDSPNDAEVCEKRDCIVLLYNVLKDELRETVNTRNDLMKEGVMTYELIWTLFEPGSVVLAGKHASRTTSSILTTKGYQVNSQYVDWDGSNFGYANSQTVVPPFAGTRPIKRLAVYPLECHEDAEDIKREIVTRATQFERLCGYHYKQYNGVAEVDSLFGRSKYTVSLIRSVCVIL